MIAQIRGTVAAIETSALVVDVGGVGYRVNTTPGTAAALTEGAEVALRTHLVVREDALELYGFTEQPARVLFEHLIGVSGVGPKSALSILSIAQPQTLMSAVAAGDTSYLTQVSGIGQKNANKIVLELKDKLGAAAEVGEATYEHDGDALEALKALGYSASESRQALQSIDASVTGTNERIKAALKHLGSGS
jgi:Holliday junction DNA helicase RuvA